ncbi:hypothetical protein ASF21_12465 [Arthrobacter sp. Leaf234]|uniref:hypothetical protein n=1 Tax=Arthrobacter sp. Leaf234 TaxID=1736303 RepID=UPI0006FD2B9A|nr:hypothetical protein [Arthrobacter sp. Leaf234]KQN99624.1 hypothetical protein ASF21_12465 [Arthrobacter sp. Leaf234]
MSPLGFLPADLHIVSQGDLLLLQAGGTARDHRTGPGAGSRRCPPWPDEAVDRVLDELERRDAAVLQ